MVSMNDWIKKNRVKIDKYTSSQYKNDDERRLWILNDEYLHCCFKKNMDL